MPSLFRGLAQPRGSSPPSCPIPKPRRALALGTPSPGHKSCRVPTCYIPGQAAKRGVPALPEVLMRSKIKCRTRRCPSAVPGAGRDIGDSTGPANPPASPVPITGLAS